MTTQHTTVGFTVALSYLQENRFITGINFYEYKRSIKDMKKLLPEGYSITIISDHKYVIHKPGFWNE